MTRRRWIADEVSGDTATLNGDNARHLAQVLRARVGEQFDIAADGRVRLGTVTRVADERVEFALGDEVAAAESDFVRRIELLLAVFKFDRMEWAIEKATELGVARITPVIARRTDSHLASAAAKRVDRWRKIAKEAAQQSRRAVVPEIAGPVKLKTALEHFGSALKVVLAETERRQSLNHSLKAIELNQPIVLAVGPEGGWTPDELELFSEKGWVSASLGATILRTETAAIAALAIVAAFPTDTQ
jgi:16S rRNA (uracil1498-N3)-methyltransferase